MPPRPLRQPPQPARGSKTEAKLKQIVLPEISFDGLPLSEVLKVLSDESIKRDPDKTGVNFLINPNVRPVALTGVIDPTTGLPLAAPTEQVDPGAVVVKFNLPLRNVTMKDVLDAIVTVADHPIQYTLEDYAVVFAAKPETVGDQPVTLARPGVVPEPAPAPRGSPSGSSQGECPPGRGARAGPGSQSRTRDLSGGPAAISFARQQIGNSRQGTAAQG